MQEALKKHAVKIQVGTLVGVIIFVISVTANTVGMKKDFESDVSTLTNQYEHCNKWYKGLEEKQDEIDNSNRSQDLIIVEIRTRLTSIESILLELKEKI